MRKLHARLIPISLALFGIVVAPSESAQAQVFDFWGRGPAEPHDERRRWRTLRTPPSVQDVAPPLPPRRPGLKFIDGKFVLDKSPGAAAWTPQKFQSPGQTARSKVRRRGKRWDDCSPKSPSIPDLLGLSPGGEAPNLLPQNTTETRPQCLAEKDNRRCGQALSGRDSPDKGRHDRRSADPKRAMRRTGAGAAAGVWRQTIGSLPPAGNRQLFPCRPTCQVAPRGLATAGQKTPEKPHQGG